MILICLYVLDLRSNVFVLFLKQFCNYKCLNTFKVNQNPTRDIKKPLTWTVWQMLSNASVAAKSHDQNPI